MWYSESESNRFQRRVCRMVIPLECTWSDAGVAESVASNRFDLLILRTPSLRLRLAGLLANTAQLSVLQTDTLLYFSKSTLDSSVPDSAEFSVTSARPRDEYLDELIRASFDGYSNHYAANSSLPDSAVMDGYSEWATSLLRDPDYEIVSATLGGKVVSFIVGCGVKRIQNEESFEIALNGTHPSFRNRGIYQALLSRLLHEARLKGFERVWISTQASNRPMIRTWEKLRFRFEFALNTLHCSQVAK